MKALNKNVLESIRKAIKSNKSFFIAGHLKPDGDTIGTSLALASVLRRLGKNPQIYSKDPIPQNLKFLPGCSNIKIKDRADGRFDCAVIMECSGFDRMGDIISPDQASTVINIDHHAHFNKFGDINLITPTASSSAEQLFNILKYMKVKVTKPEAECLYAGLVTDTGKFQQANTTSSSLIMAAELVDAGVSASYMYDKLYANKTLSSVSLLGFSLNTLKIDGAERIAYIEITKDLFEKSASNAMETEEIINYTMMISGVVVGVLFREDTEKPNTIKVSFRSRNGFDVNKTAKHFGGGGHKNAAGCTIKGSISEARKSVLNYLKEEVIDSKYS